MLLRGLVFPFSDSLSLIAAALFLFRGHFFSFTKMVERPGEMKANILPRFLFTCVKGKLPFHKEIEKNFMVQALY